MTRETAYFVGTPGSDSPTTSFRSARYQVALASGWFRLEGRVAGFDTQVAFSINRPYWVMLLDTLRDEPIGRRELPVFVRADHEVNAISRWLTDVQHVALIDDLAIDPRESLHVTQDKLFLIGMPRRDWAHTLDVLVAVADTLPPSSYPAGIEVVDGLAFDPDNLPVDLRVLTPYVTRWAVGDDVVRADRLGRASDRERHDLREVVVPRLDRINDYLDSFGEEALSNEAILVCRLAEAADELPEG